MRFNSSTINPDDIAAAHKITARIFFIGPLLGLSIHYYKSCLLCASRTPHIDLFYYHRFFRVSSW